jgi:uncharacterized membrane protein YccC
MITDTFSGQYQNARAELDAVDAALGDFYCPVLDPETDKPCGSFHKDHGAHLAMDEIERLRQQLAEKETALIEAIVENDSLSGGYQAAANEICKALSIEWKTENRYPTVAVEAIEQLRWKLNRIMHYLHGAFREGREASGKLSARSPKGETIE